MGALIHDDLFLLAAWKWDHTRCSRTILLVHVLSLLLLKQFFSIL